MAKRIILLFALISISALITGCSSNQNKTENITPINENTVSTTTSKVENDNIIATTNKQELQNEPEVNTVKSVIDLKVGDRVRNFTISKIDPLDTEKPFTANNFSISLDGSATVIGNYETNDMLGNHVLIPDTMIDLPILQEKDAYGLYFPDNDEIFKNREGRAKITFDGLILQSASEEYYMDGSKNVIKSEILK